MIEPMAVAVHSVSNIGQLKTNEVIVVMGAGTFVALLGGRWARESWMNGGADLDGGFFFRARLGPVGLLCMAVAKAIGGRRVIAVGESG
jgi:threonine dehydrogenase-like Zn-dependent dehydrogenase